MPLWASRHPRRRPSGSCWRTALGPSTGLPRGAPLTLAGHIHGGQFYLPVIGWSPGRLITKYVMGHFTQGDSQLYVSRGLGVVGVPLRVFAPPEIALFELRRPSD